MLKWMFTEQQEATLEDYKMLAVMMRYNTSWELKVKEIMGQHAARAVVLAAQANALAAQVARDAQLAQDALNQAARAQAALNVQIVLEGQIALDIDAQAPIPAQLLNELAAQLQPAQPPPPAEPAQLQPAPPAEPAQLQPAPPVEPAQL